MFKQKKYGMERIITFIFILLFSLNNAKACSCACVYFCDYADAMETGLVVYGEVTDKVSYGVDNQAIYLTVLNKIRGGDITNIVKIYGAENSVTCSESIGSYDIGDQFIFSFDDSLLHWNGPIVNPDANIEDYVEYRPVTCGRHRLSVINGMVRGKIKTGQTVSEYPLDLFIQEVNDCSFSVTNVEVAPKVEENFVIHPNPVTEVITIKNTLINQGNITVKFYSSDGKLVHVREDFPLNEQVSNLPSLGSGVFYLEIIWKRKRTVKKIILREH